MGKLIPLILLLAGLGAGIGAGLYLRPVPEPEAAEDEIEPPELPSGETLVSYEFTNQFMVPLVAEGRIVGMIVMRLALELPESQLAQVEGNAARLRDGLLQVMFDHAGSGGFDGVFTDHVKLGPLRRALLESARMIVGQQAVTRVLITDILRKGA